MRREHCAGCGATGLKQFLDLGRSPLADAFPRGPAEPQATYPLQAGVCGVCQLVQLLDVVDDESLFGGDYGYYSGASPSLADYRRRQAAELLRLAPRARDLTVEIACNDGSLMRELAASGARVVGVDPAPGPTRLAREAGLDVRTAPFGRDVAAELVAEYGRAGLVVAANVAGHVADLDDFFGGIRALLAADGVAVVEVQSLADLILGNQFDHVYHEHRSYFSVTSLARTADRSGLSLREVWPLPTQGGSFRAALTVGDSHAGPQAAVTIRSEDWLRDGAVYDSMQGRVEAVRSGLLRLLDGERAAARTVVGYAASAKATTLLHFCGIGSERLAAVVDRTPAKIGRFMPGTAVPVVGADGDVSAPVDTLLVLARNYLPALVRRRADWLAGGGRLIVPIPQPVIL